MALLGKDPEASKDKNLLEEMRHSQWVLEGIGFVFIYGFLSYLTLSSLVCYDVNSIDHMLQPPWRVALSHTTGTLWSQK